MYKKMLSLATSANCLIRFQTPHCWYRSKILQGTLKNTPFLQVPVQTLDRYPQLLLF